MGQPNLKFEKQLMLGRLGEKLISDWLICNGYGLIPSYEYTGKDGNKTPRLQFEKKKLVIPDIDVCKNGNRFWLEVKTMHISPINRRMNANVHGIKEKLYRDYLEVERTTGTSVVLGILEVKSGCFLTGELSKLKTFPCQCRACQTDAPEFCCSPIKNNIYFLRDDLQVKHQFQDGRIQEIKFEFDPKNEVPY